MNLHASMSFVLKSDLNHVQVLLLMCEILGNRFLFHCLHTHRSAVAGKGGRLKKSNIHGRKILANCF